MKTLKYKYYQTYYRFYKASYRQSAQSPIQNRKRFIIVHLY